MTPPPIDPAEVVLNERIARLEVLVLTITETLRRVEARLDHLVTKETCEKRHEPLMRQMLSWGQLILLVLAFIGGYLKLHGMEVRQAQGKPPTTIVAPSPPATVVVQHQYPQRPDAGPPPRARHRRQPRGAAN